MHKADAALVQACVEGRGEAWRQFVEKYGRLILMIIGRTSGQYGAFLGHDETEDLCADIFHALVKDNAIKLRAYNPAYSLTTYLGVIARSMTIDFLRSKRGPRVAHEENDPAASSVLGLDHLADEHAVDPGEQIERDERARAVNEVLEALSPRERLVVKLFYYGGKKYREIAEMLGIPLNTVCSTLARALEKLREKLKDVPELRAEEG